jgi:hypothetical protein
MTPSDGSHLSKDAASIQSALRGVLGGVMRQLRKYTALSEFLELIPDELLGQVAPFDVRLAPPLDTDHTSASRGAWRTKTGAAAGKDAAGGSDAAAPPPDEVTTLYLYVVSATVQLILEQKKREYMDALNARLPYPLIEEIRFEQVNSQKIAKQLNILGISPD